MQNFNIYHLVAVLIALFTPFTALSGPNEDFRALVFKETEHFVLEKVNFDKENMFLRADYNYKPLDKKATLLLQYGKNDVIEEEAQVLASNFKIHYSIDRSAIREVLSRSEMREIYDRFKELYNHKGYIKWQIQHGTLADEYPVVKGFPLEYKSFSIKTFEFNRGEFRASYQAAENEGYPGITLVEGEAARQYAQREFCADLEKVNINDTPFYSREGKRSYSLLTKLDNVFISVDYRYGDNPDKASIQSKTKRLAKGLDLERIRNFEPPRIEGPGKGIQKVEIDANDFIPFFPKKSGDLTLQKIHSYPGTMHIRADYLYEPENHQVSLHMALGNYRHRLKTGLRGSSVGNFSIAYETGCLGEKIGKEAVRQVVSSIPVPGEADIVQWEMKNIDYTVLNSLAGYFPESFGKFTVESFSPDDDELEVKSKYAVSGRKEPIIFNVVYGEEAAQIYNKYQFTMFKKEAQLLSFNLDELTFDGAVMNESVIAAHYNDQLLITASMKKDENNEEVTAIINEIENFLSGFNVSRFLDWESPENYSKEFDDTMDDGTKICLDTQCMDAHIERCEPAAFTGRLNYRLGVIYKIEGTREDQCHMSMTYTANPNDEWEDKPLYFYVQPGESFKTVVKEKIKECIEGNSSNCHGPLMDVINQK
jgi:hypothetical protein